MLPKKTVVLILLFLGSMQIAIAAGKQGEVPVVEILKINAPPVIDGKLDDFAWYGAVFGKSCFAGYFSDVYTQVALWQPITYAVYDDKNLYIGYCAYVPAGATLCVKSTSADFFWNDDLVQVFVEPKLDLTALFFAVNANGIATSGDGIAQDREVQAAAVRGNGYWTAEMAIPWKKLHVKSLKTGALMGFNVIVYQSFKEEGWLSWMPLYGPGMTPERFGYIRLGNNKSIPALPKKISEDNF
ncbi:MAG: sugar-binding protein [Kiritimatiellia bacterium]|nr:sugar-binding protein [Kiritimatiellia bacterium]